MKLYDHAAAPNPLRVGVSPEFLAKDHDFAAAMVELEPDATLPHLARLKR